MFRRYSRVGRWVKVLGRLFAVGRPPRGAGFDYAVGPWQVNVREGSVIGDGRERQLELQTMAVLHYLARNPGRVVSRDELVREAWDGAAVSDGAVNRCIAGIRRALGDDALDPEYIRTHPKRGYQLIASVEAPRVGRGGLGWLVATGLVAAAATVWLAVALAQPRAAPALMVETFRDLGPTSIRQQLGVSLTDELLAELSAPSEPLVLYVDDSARPQASADAVLSGNVRHGEDELRVSCQLTAPSNGRVICAGTCAAPPGDEMTTLRRIAGAITADVRRSLVRRP